MARDRVEPLPHTFARGTSSALPIVGEPRAILFSRIAERSRWMENEVARSGTHATSVHSITQLVELLVGDVPGSRPTLAVIDLDGLDAGELFYLHRIRELGFGGTLVVLGKVPFSLRTSMGIDRMVMPPYAEDVLCEEIHQHLHDSQASTVPIPLPLLG